MCHIYLVLYHFSSYLVLCYLFGRIYTVIFYKNMVNVPSGKFSCPSVPVYKLYTTHIRTSIYEGSVYLGSQFEGAVCQRIEVMTAES